jgi:hypothetical protein
MPRLNVIIYTHIIHERKTQIIFTREGKRNKTNLILYDSSQRSQARRRPCFNTVVSIVLLPATHVQTLQLHTGSSPGLGLLRQISG